MGTKNNPGTYDCYANADPDEPMFVLLARDKHAPALVRLWAELRVAEKENPEKIAEALKCSDSMVEWQAANSRGRFKEDTGLRVVKRNYWNAEQSHCPYQNCLHDKEDKALDNFRVFEWLLSGIKDGDEIEIVVRPTGKRPFGDRRYVWQEPHTYGPETDEQVTERQTREEVRQQFNQKLGRQ